MATKFWVGGGANANFDTVNNWSLSSGGTNNQSIATGDDAVFDAGSAAAACTLNVAFSLNSLDCNGYTGTLTHNAVTLTITGNDASAPGGQTLRLSAGITY